MKISSINVALPKNYSYQTKVKEAQAHSIAIEQPSFKGLKGGFFAALGGAAGAALGIVLSGGVALPLILAGAGTIAGGEYGNKDEPTSDEYGSRSDDLSGFDYIG